MIEPEKVTTRTARASSRLKMVGGTKVPSGSVISKHYLRYSIHCTGTKILKYLIYSENSFDINLFPVSHKK